MKKRVRKKGEAAELEMTPMIDVVFQLLIFFLVTLKQEDILSHLDVSRPAADQSATEETVRDLLTITVHRYGYMLKGKERSLEQLSRDLSRLARLGSKDVSVIIRCTADSQHERLVEVLNLCAKVGMKKLSVFSM